jgi:integrase
LIYLLPILVLRLGSELLYEVYFFTKLLGKELEIETPITTYVARHTYAKVLKRSDVSTSIISNTLDHESESITQTYLDDFGSDVFFEDIKHLL